MDCLLWTCFSWVMPLEFRKKPPPTQPPPELAEERQRKTPHTSVSRSVFLGTSHCPWEKDVENQEYHPPISCTLGHLIASFKHISTTTTMPCDCPGKLRSWVAERVKTVCLQTQREAKKTKINMQLVQLTKKWNNVFFSNTCFMFSLVGKILQKCYFSMNKITLHLWLLFPLAIPGKES